MKEKQTNMMNEFLTSKDKHSAANKLEKYQLLHKNMPQNDSIVGMMVHSLILNKLMKKVNKENKENKSSHAAQFDKYHQDRFNEKKYLEELKARLEEKKEKAALEKEERQHAYDEKKEERQYGRDINKAHATTQISHEASRKDKMQDLILKTIADPMEALEYAKDPEKHKLEKFDDNSFISKVWGKTKEKLGGTYKPKTKLRIQK
jgi:hypothetical protein